MTTFSSQLLVKKDNCCDEISVVCNALLPLLKNVQVNKIELTTHTKRHTSQLQDGSRHLTEHLHRVTIIPSTVLSHTTLRDRAGRSDQLYTTVCTKVYSVFLYPQKDYADN